ncbi:MAG TPA: hypothetical protein ENF18_06215, partial [candidate division WOR-3 bacterium]|nr:hypothetical protein [candidate division WOR-3 bacterium]
MRKTLFLILFFSSFLYSEDKVIPQWLNGDIHIHSTYSKGILGTGPGDGTPYQLTERALNPDPLQSKLDFIVITDSNYAFESGQWDNLIADCNNVTNLYINFLASAGTEIGGNNGHTGAILFKILPSDVSNWDDLSNFQKIIQIHNYGGLAVANHACGGSAWGFGSYNFEDGGDCSEIIDCIEIYNGMWQFDCQTDMYGNPCGDAIALQKWEEFLLEGKRIVAVGGSDCHTYNEDVPGSRDPDVNPYNWRVPLAFPHNQILIKHWPADFCIDSLRKRIKEGRVVVADFKDQKMRFQVIYDAPDENLPSEGVHEIGDNIFVKSSTPGNLMIHIEGTYRYFGGMPGGGWEGGTYVRVWKGKVGGEKTCIYSHEHDQYYWAPGNPRSYVEYGIVGTDELHPYLEFPLNDVNTWEPGWYWLRCEYVRHTNIPEGWYGCGFVFSNPIWIYIGPPGSVVYTEGIMDISPALMDINDDGKQEIFFACDDGDGDGKGKVYAYDSDWNLMWAKNVQGDIGANPCVSDLDNDGNYEFIVATVSGWFYVLDVVDGNPIQGWPVSLNAECYSSPACGDLDGDGIKEIVIGSSNGVYVLSPGGSIHDIEWIGWSFYAGINLVDIDKDGDLDILATPSTNDHAYIFPIWMDYEGGKLIVVQTDVKMLPRRNGRAVKIPEKFGKPESFNYYNIATPAVGDIDGDGWIDVISIETGIDGNIVHRWEYTYSHGWRVSEVWQDRNWGEIMGMYSSPVITDVDNDGKGEVIVAGNYDPGINFGYLKLKCYEHTGEIKWHKEITGYDVWPNSPYSSPALGDIDNDGKEEIVIGSDIGNLYS